MKTFVKVLSLLDLIVFVLAYDRSIISDVPSIFGPGEEFLDRYSDVLSALEPLKAQRARQVRESVNPLTYLWLQVRHQGNPYPKLLQTEGGGLQEARTHCEDYLLQSSRLITDMGLDVQDFNNASKQLSEHPEMQKRVETQMKRYKEARRRLMAESSTVTAAQGQGDEPKLDRFARAVLQIEEIRLCQRGRLLDQLGSSSRDLPQGLCAPPMFRLAAEPVRNICLEFEEMAEGVVAEAGLTNCEFNTLLRRSRSNPMSALQLKRRLRALGGAEKHDLMEFPANGTGHQGDESTQYLLDY
eukprot:CAMPEP_0113943912 /NCGR_PEP_ID=MMETSP1339-20121228/29439_1 /TAXON_ID=94617 /ORGANISM="Fibrocapsa japonica" /LENGTH=298 /DNA_ID=CAMNT_0000948913 /DNA_START=65 /DNA_END=962 /DNA_ORIENTATION=+ /assembly_acc=CAM_ASM_000762